MAGLTIPLWEVVLRFLLASLLCGAIGFEREIRDQHAGFRTHILLGLGAALFTLVSAYGSEPFVRAALEGDGLQFDPTYQDRRPDHRRRRLSRGWRDHPAGRGRE